MKLGFRFVLRRPAQTALELRRLRGGLRELFVHKQPFLLLIVASLLLALRPQPAEAHMLGGFTIDRYSRIEVYSNQVRVRYVLDMSEILTLEEQSQVDTNNDGVIDDAENQAYRVSHFAAIGQALTLELNGARLQLKPISSELNFPIGQGNMPTLRLSGWFTAPYDGRAGQSESLYFRDDNFSDRLGWKEIVATAGDGIQISKSSVSAVDQTNELRNFPDQLLVTPLDEREAQVSFQIIAVSTTAPALPAAGAANVIRSLDPFTQLIGVGELSPAVILFSLCAALVWGSLHAFSPGHGKSVVAAYLVGSRGTARHAVYLGLTVTATHTIGVYLLGFITLIATQYILPEKLYPVLGIISGLIVVLIGVGIFISRLRGAAEHTHDHAHGLAHSHTHDEHTHAHHDHAHQHPGLTADDKPLNMRGLLALGISGGLIPCPSALVVMLAAIALHRVEFGLILIIAFSAGLALVLMGTGLLLVYAGRIFNRLSLDSRLVRVIPALSALAMIAAGLVITAEAVTQIWTI